MQIPFHRILFHQARVYWPLLVASLLLLINILRVYGQVTEANDGLLVYTLDDAYIHMSVAKNFAQHGNWGITPFEFSSSTSSPLWTLWLAISYFFTGINFLNPLILNVIIGFGMLMFVEWILRRSQILSVYRVIVLIALIIYSPLDAYIFMGMEHLLHGFLTLVFAYFAADYLANDITPLRHDRDLIRLCVTGAFLTFTRYEGAFIVGIVVLLTLWRGRWLQAMLIAVVSALPNMIYGLISIVHGWKFIPVSVLLKSSGDRSVIKSLRSLDDVVDFVLGTYEAMFPWPLYVTAIIIATIVMLIYFRENQNPWARTPILMTILIGAILVHFRFITDESVFNRYTAYLILFLIVTIGLGISELLPRQVNWHKAHIALLALPGFFYVTGHLDVRLDFMRDRYPIVGASQDIYQQHYQMGRFVSTYYEGAAIILNDIGAVNFFADIHLVDIVGLGTIEIAQSRLENGTVPKMELNALIEEEDVQIAIVYTSWASYTIGEIPPEWIQVGRWSLTEGHVVGDTNVDFYAISAKDVQPLIAKLQQFKDLLPHAVFQQGRYVNELASVPASEDE